MKNTKISYLYRDTSNYKQYNWVVVAGGITEKEKNTILAACQDEEYFVPEQVGLPCERFASLYEDDTSFCEIGRNCFELTEQDPTVSLTVDELTKAFAAVKEWDSEYIWH